MTANSTPTNQSEEMINTINLVQVQQNAPVNEAENKIDLTSTADNRSTEQVLLNSKGTDLSNISG